MLNFTVGPVMSDEEICAIGGEQVPYFRTAEFSQLMLENEKLIKKFANADENSKAVFITGSGTASMEAAVINTLTKDDKALIINGGSFGQRFVRLCEIHKIPFEQIKLEHFEALTREKLEGYNNGGYTSLLVNMHETSTGVLYDMNMLSEFCKKNNLFFIVDAISSFLADEFYMKAMGVDVMITGSQKALACAPGISIIVLSEKATERTMKNNSACMYLDLKDALSNAKRGQTPFTPAVSILRQINFRLNSIENNGGVACERKKIQSVALDFREKVKGLPFETASHSMSNAVTPLHPLTASANDIFLHLKDEYGIWVCPNGGELKDQIFRVGHIGNISAADNDTLISALKDLQKRRII